MSKNLNPNGIAQSVTPIFSVEQKTGINMIPIFDSSIREKRIQPHKSILLKVFVNNIPVEIENISDSGMAFASESTFIQNENSELRIEFSGDQHLLLKGKVVWTRQINGRSLNGFQFSQEYLPEGFLEALDRTQLIKINIQDNLKIFTSLDNDFKNLTFEIKNYLEITKDSLDRLEEEILVYSENVRNSYREVIKSNFESDFVGMLKDYSKKLDGIFSKMENSEIRKYHTDFFRSQVGKYYTNNPFIGRALRKPRGYSGDFEMMNQIYRDNFEGRTFFEMLMHKYGINESSSLSVKYRRKYFVNHILEFSSKHSVFNVCSVACGPAKEVVDFLNIISVPDSEKYNFYLLDQDIEALLSAKRNIYEVIMRRGLKTKVEFLPVSVKDVLEGSPDIKKLSHIGFHFMYTAGLYDYLSQPVAKMLTTNLLSWLTPESMMIIGNFHPSNPTKTISELVADWKLIHRNDEEMLDLVQKDKVKNVRLHKDDQNIDIFLEIVV